MSNEARPFREQAEKRADNFNPRIYRGSGGELDSDYHWMQTVAEYPSIKCSTCGAQREGAHYNIWVISSGGAEGLRKMFGDPPKANYMNFALFSTSGVHGNYTTIEQIEASLVKYGYDPAFMHEDNEDNIPDDYHGPSLTVTIYHPRIIGVGYGNIEVTLEDITFLKALRQSSWDAIQTIGREESVKP